MSRPDEEGIEGAELIYKYEDYRDMEFQLRLSKIHFQSSVDIVKSGNRYIFTPFTL